MGNLKKDRTLLKPCCKGEPHGEKVDVNATSDRTGEGMPETEGPWLLPPATAYTGSASDSCYWSQDQETALFSMYHK